MTFDWLDIITTILGLIYIWLEYRAHIALWIVGIIMPALDAVLYWNHGLYGDAGMACYYTLAAFYGLFFWKFKKTRKKKESPCGVGSNLLCAHQVDRLYSSRT